MKKCGCRDTDREAGKERERGRLPLGRKGITTNSQSVCSAEKWEGIAGFCEKSEEKLLNLAPDSEWFGQPLWLGRHAVCGRSLHVALLTFQGVKL